MKINKPVIFPKEKVAGRLIFAIDYDGTIVEKYKDNSFKALSKCRLRPHAKRVLKAIKASGHYIVIWTAREGPLLRAVRKTLTENGVPFDAINANVLPIYDCATKQFCWAAPRKIIAHYYIDDRSIPPFTNWLEVEKFLREKGLIEPVTRRKLK